MCYHVDPRVVGRLAGKCREGIAMELFGEDTGSGPLLVLLHGFGATHVTWRFLADDLKKDFRILALDLKGFGQSPNPVDSAYTLLDQARLTADKIAGAGVTECIIAGHSFGAAVALQTALDLEDRHGIHVSALILMAAAVNPRRNPPGVTPRPDRPEQPKLRLGNGPAAQVEFALRSSFYDPDKVTEASIQAYAQLLKSPGSVHALKQTRRNSKVAHVWHWQRYTQPVLLIWGRQDWIVPLEDARWLRDRLACSRLAIIEHCGHVPQEEKPGETLWEVRSFLAQLDLPPPFGICR